MSLAARELAAELRQANEEAHALFLLAIPSLAARGRGSREVLKALAQIDAELAGRDAGTPSLRIDKRWSRLSTAVLNWLAFTARCEGFGGYPTYARWFSALHAALSSEFELEVGCGEEGLLRLTRERCALYLATQRLLGVDTWLITTEQTLPSLSSDVLPKRRLLPNDWALCDRYWHFVTDASGYLGVPAPIRDQSRHGNFTRELGYVIDIVDKLSTSLNSKLTQTDVARLQERVPEREPTPKAKSDSLVFVRTRAFKKEVDAVLASAARGDLVIVHSGAEQRAQVSSSDERAGELPLLDRTSLESRAEAFVLRAYRGERFLLDKEHRIVLQAPDSAHDEATSTHHWKATYANDPTAPERVRATYWKDPDASRQRVKDEYWRDPEASRQREREKRAADPEAARESVRKSRRKARESKKQRRADEFVSEIRSSLGLEVRRLDGLGRLSHREREVVKLFLMGLSHAEVAVRLRLSSGAVSTLRTRALKKLDLSSLAGLLADNKN